MEVLFGKFTCGIINGFVPVKTGLIIMCCTAFYAIIFLLMIIIVISNDYFSDSHY